VADAGPIGSPLRLREKYHELTHTDGVPFVPYGVWKDAVFSGVILLAIAACALYFGPFGPSGQPDPRVIQTAPRPDYFFLWLYALLSLLPPALETPVLLIGPAIALIVLLALPFVSGEGEKSWKRRPIAVLTILLSRRIARHVHQHGRPCAVESGDGCLYCCFHPREASERTHAAQIQGALVFQEKQCHNCHALGGIGGQRGPALDAVALFA
jgi:ubiquinol-cytochrome c reductase cytochrome b subunit